MRMNAPISISAAAPKVATARKMSAGDKECIVASQFAKPRGPIVNSYAQEMFRPDAQCVERNGRNRPRPDAKVARTQAAPMRGSLHGDNPHLFQSRFRQLIHPLPCEERRKRAAISALSRTAQTPPHNPDASATARGGSPRCRRSPRPCGVRRAGAARRCRGRGCRNRRPRSARS